MAAEQLDRRTRAVQDMADEIAEAHALLDKLIGSNRGERDRDGNHHWFSLRGRIRKLEAR